METIDIRLLHPHPRNKKIYGDEDVTFLVERIRESKWIKPLIVTQNNTIISGHSRWQAALTLGYEQLEVERRTCKDETEELEFLLLENVQRLKTPLQMVREGETWDEIEKAGAEKRRQATLKQNNSTIDRDVDYPSVDPNLGQRKDKEKKKRAPQSSDKVAEKVGFGSASTYEKAKKVVSTADGLIEQGKIEEGQALLDLLNHKSVHAAAIAATTRHIKEVTREEKREENRQTIAQAQTIEDALGLGKFSTIVLDPPWDWGDEGDVDQLGRAKPTYSTMSLAELLAFPVGSYADKDCHLYLWITNRSLPKGFHLMEQWGFRYITCVTWVKPHFGMGNYFRGQTEHLLFGVKGSLPLKRKDVGTIFHAPRGPKGHSSKPSESYALIESSSPGPYLELFARSGRTDWTSWGGELQREQEAG